ncbi:hypothetical protein EDB92DRAFT_2102088 [Lactarius akahatsu]|uniref:Uncharacterized protein n=1 Tax=Lactarius akahatsu TaxID=416441 RepID=A0AAD4LKD9_9AGAM|nr:hypothetical protein EDB92DRAFT_2102088 [Lactarius akahatsu]
MNGCLKERCNADGGPSAGPFSSALALLTPHDPFPIAEEADITIWRTPSVKSPSRIGEASERAPITSLEVPQHYHFLEAGTQPHGNIWRPFFRIKQKRGILSPTNVYKATTAMDLIHNLWEVYVHTRHITRSPEENPIGSPLFRKGHSSSLWSIEDAKTPRPKQLASLETAPAQLWISVVQGTVNKLVGKTSRVRCGKWKRHWRFIELLVDRRVRPSAAIGSSPLPQGTRIYQELAALVSDPFHASSYSFVFGDSNTLALDSACVPTYSRRDPVAAVPRQCRTLPNCYRYEVLPALSEPTSSPYARRMPLREHKQVLPVFQRRCTRLLVEAPAHMAGEITCAGATSKGPSYVAPQHDQ